MTVSAIYENGVFRPTGPVALPEGAAVRVVPEPAGRNGSRADDVEVHRLRIHELLGQSFDLGPPGGDAPTDHNDPGAYDPKPTDVEALRLEIYDLLCQSSDLGPPDLAERHNEHQP